jgi:hypothetical protein
MIAMGEYSYFQTSSSVVGADPWTDAGWCWHPLYGLQCGEPKGAAPPSASQPPGPCPRGPRSIDSGTFVRSSPRPRAQGVWMASAGVAAKNSSGFWNREFAACAAGLLSSHALSYTTHTNTPGIIRTRRRSSDRGARTPSGLHGRAANKRGPGGPPVPLTIFRGPLSALQSPDKEHTVENGLITLA